MHGREQADPLKTRRKRRFYPRQRVRRQRIHHEISKEPLRKAGDRSGYRRLITRNTRNQSGPRNAVPVQFVRPLFGQILWIDWRRLPAQETGHALRRRVVLPQRRILLLRRQRTKKLMREEMNMSVVDAYIPPKSLHWLIIFESYPACPSP